jgi:O-antigen ligase
MFLYGGALFLFLILAERLINVPAFKPYRVVGALLLIAAACTGRLRLDPVMRFAWVGLLYACVLALPPALGDAASANAAWNAAALYAFGLTTFMVVVAMPRSGFSGLLLVLVIGALLNAVVILSGNGRVLSASTGLRYAGLFKNPTLAAFALALGAMALLYLGQRPLGSMSLWLRCLCSTALLVVLAMAMIRTGSRIGLIATVVAAIVYAALRQGGPRWLLLALVVAVAGFAASADLRQQVSVAAARFQEKFAEGTDVRIYLWQSGLEALVDSDGLGLGIGQYRMHHEHYFADKQFAKRSLYKGKFDLHSDLVAHLVEHGVIGFAAFVGVLGWLICAVRRAPPELRGLLASLWILMVTTGTLHQMSYSALYWIAAGLIVLGTRHSDATAFGRSATSSQIKGA